MAESRVTLGLPPQLNTAKDGITLNTHKINQKYQRTKLYIYKPEVTHGRQELQTLWEKRAVDSPQGRALTEEGTAKTERKHGEGGKRGEKSENKHRELHKKTTAQNH